MPRFRAPAVALAVLLAALLLAACQTTGPADTPPPAGPPADGPPSDGPPSGEPTGLIDSIDPAAALPGEQVTLTGEGFGTAGTATVADLPAGIVSWTADTIDLTVPGAPGGWRTLAIAPEPGGSGTAPLFVGVEATTDTTADPQRFQEFLDALEPGTHVLLPPGELDLTDVELVIDGVHLHGHPDGTSLALGSGGVAMIVSKEGSVGAYDLEVDGAFFDLRTALPGGIVPLQVGHTAITIERLEYSGASFGARSAVAAGYADLKLVDSRIVATGQIHLELIGSLEIEGSALHGNLVYLMSHGGSTVATAATLASQGTMSIAAEVNVYIDGSRVSVADGNLHVTAYGGVGPDNLAPGQVMIERSELEANEVAANGTPDDQSGEISISASGGTVLLFDNKRIQALDEVRISAVGRPGDAATVKLQNNELIAAGLNPDGSPTGSPSGVYVSIGGGERPMVNVLELIGNDIRAGRTLEFRIDSNYADASVSDNRLRAGVGGLEGIIEMYGVTVGDLLIADNELEAAATVRVHPPEGAGGGESVTFARNTVTVSGGVATLDLFSRSVSCSYTDNVIHLRSTAATGQTVTFDCEHYDEPGSTGFEVSGNRVEVEGAYGRVSVTSNDGIDISGNFFASSRFEGRTTTGNLLVTANEFSEATIELIGYDESVTFEDNEVESLADAGLALRVTGGRDVTVEGNSFVRLGTPTGTMTAAAFDSTLAESTLAITGNTFEDYTHALRFIYQGTEATALVSGNNFDFAFDAAGAAANISLTDSALTLDLGTNRWGNVTTNAQLEDRIRLNTYENSSLNLIFGTVLSN